MSITKQQTENFSQKSDVETKVKSYYDYVTGSAGGWPNLSRAAIISGIDFTIESGSNEVKFFETNTNLYTAQVSTYYGDYYNDIAHYAVSNSFDNVIIYGSVPGQRSYNNYENPPQSERVYISSSFASLNLSCSFNDTTDRQYIDQRGDASYSNTLHFFQGTPFHTDDSLYQIISGSKDKREFRDILSRSPVSASLIELYNSSSKSPDTGLEDYPDFVNKTPTGDASFQRVMNGKIYFNTYFSNNEPSASQKFQSDFVTSDTINEKFIISSGSYQYGKRYIGQGRVVVLQTPEETKPIYSFYNPMQSTLVPIDDNGTGVSTWNQHAYAGFSSMSGSLIRMYDGSTKQIQDVEVGDVVKSYQPIGMPDSDLDYMNYEWPAEDLSATQTGSYATGSVVVSKSSRPTRHYYIVSGSDNNQYYIHQLSSTFVWDDNTDRYRFKLGWQIEVDDKLFSHDTSKVDVVEVLDNYQGNTVDFYSLDVEDIDTYFTSDILVHNLPGK